MMKAAERLTAPEVEERREPARRRSRLGAGFLAAGIGLWVASASASVAPPPVLAVSAATEAAHPLVDVATNKKKQVETGARLKPPVRGSSADVGGGSSADRYGGSSADTRGVAGRRDARLFPKKEKVAGRDAEDRRLRRDADDQDRDQDKELEPDQEKEAGNAKANKK